MGLLGLVAIYAASDIVSNFVIKKTGILNNINKEIDEELEKIEKEMFNK